MKFRIPLLTLVTTLPLATIAADSLRKGGERQIYRDPDTGRTVWRMTVSQTNDKHCYYSEQPWSPDMKKILFSVGLPTDQSKVGSIWVMDADGSNFKKLVDGVPYTMHTGANPVWSKDGERTVDERNHAGRGVRGASGRFWQRGPDDVL